MKVKDLLKQLKGLEEYDILFSSDEELNCLRERGEVAVFSDKKKTVVIYGFDGTELG
jgi:hypothetical protein